MSEPTMTVHFTADVPMCRVAGCEEALDADQIVCDRHWGRVDPKTQARFFEALMAVLDEAEQVPAVMELAFV